MYKNKTFSLVLPAYNEEVHIKKNIEQFLNTNIFDEIKLKVNKRLISIGRLDFNSEGLLLLTNNGDFARKLELPQNKFQRTYKVRIFGTIDNKMILLK